MTRDSRLKREPPRREAGVARKGESDGGEANRPTPRPKEPTMTQQTDKLAARITDDLIAGIGRGEIVAQGEAMDLLTDLRAYFRTPQAGDGELPDAVAHLAKWGLVDGFSAHYTAPPTPVLVNPIALLNAMVDFRRAGIARLTTPSTTGNEQDSYAAWQQKRGMLADKVDWAIGEYDGFMLDDAYDAQRVLDHIIDGLRTTRAALSTPTGDEA